jgi:hypothetical protein
MGTGRTTPTGPRQHGHARLGKEEAHAVKVGPSEGNQSKGAKERRESECPIGAMTTGNGWHPDPDEQSGHVLV